MKKINKNLIFGLIILYTTYYILHTSVAYAQFDLPTIGSIKPTISLSSNPVTPLPNSTIVITANLSGLIGNGNSNYTWFLNGARQANASGTNKNNFTFRVGAIGAVYRISVNVTTPGADFLSETINLTVGDVDLTWTTNSKIPIFYRAKSLPTQNSVVTVSALPFVYRPGTKSLVKPENLIYDWIIDDKLDSGKSGRNKFSYVLAANNFPGHSYSIRLKVKTDDEAVSLEKNMVIPVVSTQVWLYFSDPKTNQPFGIALKNVMAGAANFNFAAQAYFFTAPMENLNWQWFINNAEVRGGEEKPWLATLNLANDFSGAFSAQIKVTARNTVNEFESAQSTTNLEIK